MDNEWKSIGFPPSCLYYSKTTRSYSWGKPADTLKKYQKQNGSNITNNQPLSVPIPVEDNDTGSLPDDPKHEDALIDQVREWFRLHFSRFLTYLSRRPAFYWTLAILFIAVNHSFVLWPLSFYVFTCESWSGRFSWYFVSLVVFLITSVVVNYLMLVEDRITRWFCLWWGFVWALGFFYLVAPFAILMFNVLGYILGALWFSILWGVIGVILVIFLVLTSK